MRIEHRHERGTISSDPNSLRGVGLDGRIILKRKSDTDRLEEYRSSVRRVRKEPVKR
jgi:hypothetical protein